MKKIIFTLLYCAITTERGGKMWMKSREDVETQRWVWAITKSFCYWPGDPLTLRLRTIYISNSTKFVPFLLYTYCSIIIIVSVIYSHTLSHDATTLAIFWHPLLKLFDFIEIRDRRPSVHFNILLVGASQPLKVGSFLKCKVVGRNEMKAPLFQLLGTM